MLKIELLHPDILMALGSNGHGSKILIADGNFPISTCGHPLCKKVFLNLSPGLLKVTDVLKVLKNYMVIETGVMMIPPDEVEQPVHAEFRQILGGDIQWVQKKRFEFYQEVKSEDTCLMIATGETRRFANIVLVMGSVRPVIPMDKI